MVWDLTYFCVIHIGIRASIFALNQVNSRSGVDGLQAIAGDLTTKKDTLTAVVEDIKIQSAQLLKEMREGCVVPHSKPIVEPSVEFTEVPTDVKKNA